MLKKVTLTIAAVALAAVVIAGFFVYQNFGSPALEQVVVGHVPVESFALLYTAQNRGYFAANGLNVTVTDYSTGTVAEQALTSGAVDIAGSSEYVVAFNAVEKQNVTVFASLGESQIVDLIGREDHGIASPADLKGKTVATAKSTVAEFDLGRFLIANGMTMQDINLVYMPPTQFASAIANGSVDAVVSWQLYNEQTKMALQTGFVDWPLQTDEPFFSVLSCRSNWLPSHQETVNKFLKALSQAEDYLGSNPADVEQIVRDRFNYTDAYMASVWARNNCTLTLTAKLQSVMEHEATWMINNGLTTQKTEPTIADYIATASLRAIKPQAVTIP